MGDVFRGFKPNGSGKPTTIQADGIPIIGQAFQMKGGFPTASIQCGCPGRDAVLLVGATPGQCQSCKRVFVMQTFQFDGRTGQISANIALAQAQPEPAATPEPEPVPS